MVSHRTETFFIFCRHNFAVGFSVELCRIRCVFGVVESARFRYSHIHTIWIYKINIEIHMRIRTKCMYVCWNCGCQSTWLIAIILVILLCYVLWCPNVDINLKLLYEWRASYDVFGGNNAGVVDVNQPTTDDSNEHTRKMPLRQNRISFGLFHFLKPIIISHKNHNQSLR